MLTDGFQIMIAETFGTALLIILGDGVVAGVLLARSKAQNSGWIVITTGWALAVAVGVYAVGGISGGAPQSGRDHRPGRHRPADASLGRRAVVPGRRVPGRLHRRGRRLAALSAALGRRPRTQA